MYVSTWSEGHVLTRVLEACSYGLADGGDDLLMSNWNGTILGPPHVCYLRRQESGAD